MKVITAAKRAGLSKARIIQALHAMNLGRKDEYGFFQVEESELDKIIARKGMKGKNLRKE